MEPSANSTMIKCEALFILLILVLICISSLRVSLHLGKFRFAALPAWDASLCESFAALCARMQEFRVTLLSVSCSKLRAKFCHTSSSLEIYIARSCRGFEQFNNDSTNSRARITQIKSHSETRPAQELKANSRPSIELESLKVRPSRADDTKSDSQLARAACSRNDGGSL